VVLLEQEQAIEHWRIVVICPNRCLNFGSANAMAEFVRERVHWLELEPAATDPNAPPMLRALALLVQPGQDVPDSSAAIQAQVAGHKNETWILNLIDPSDAMRFNGRSISELCAMAGITLDAFTQSVAYREFFGQGLQEGELEAWLQALD
jgi:hypothetical protein